MVFTISQPRRFVIKATSEGASHGGSSGSCSFAAEHRSFLPVLLLQQGCSLQWLHSGEGSLGEERGCGGWVDYFFTLHIISRLEFCRTAALQSNFTFLFHLRDIKFLPSSTMKYYFTVIYKMQLNSMPIKFVIGFQDLAIIFIFKQIYLFVAVNGLKRWCFWNICESQSCVMPPVLAHGITAVQFYLSCSVSNYFIPRSLYASV